MEEVHGVEAHDVDQVVLAVRDVGEGDADQEGGADQDDEAVAVDDGVAEVVVGPLVN